MKRKDNTLKNMMDEAEAKAKAQEEIDTRNRKRRAKGRKPLPDLQEAEEMKVGRRKYRTGDRTVIGSEDALKLFELRKADMEAGESVSGIPMDDDDAPEDFVDPRKVQAAPPPAREPDVHSEQSEKAVKAAEAARKVQDMKNGRIDHEGNWAEGQTLEGGDATSLWKHDKPSIWSSDGNDISQTPAMPETHPLPQQDMIVLFNDLYKRLGTSFDAIEQTLSDLQGRVNEIVTATTPTEPPMDDTQDDSENEFRKLLEQTTPVTFDVGGTQMTFDAITVFHAPPCITIVSKIGSAKITPKPGAQLKLTYTMDGIKYLGDPVTFLGTRFDLPMFGLSFVGFIRDKESDMMDVEAGVEANTEVV